MQFRVAQLAAGTASALAAVGTTEFVAVLTGLRSPLDDAVRISVDRSPALVVETTVRVLGVADKPVARASALAVIALASTGAACRGRRAAAAAPVLGAAAGLLAARRRPPLDPVPLQAVALGAGAAAGVAAALARPRVAALLALGGAAGLLASLRSRGGAQRKARAEALSERLIADVALPPPLDGAEHWPGAAPLHTPLNAMYVTDVNMRPPRIDRATWRLTVDGAVGEPCELSDSDLLTLGTVELDATLVCIHSRPGWHRLAHQRFTGVPFARVLAAAGGALPGAVDLQETAVDGYTMRRPITVPDDALVVLGIGGRRLAPEHGAPARLLVPGFYGQYAGVKWLRRLTVLNHEGSFYWASRGWPAEPREVRPMSRIDAVGGTPVPVRADLRSYHVVMPVTAGSVAVVGTAWAPVRGVDRVQVRVDEGPWHDAELAGETSPRSWRRWRCDVAVRAGARRLQVRCAERATGWQNPSPRSPHPLDATGLHQVLITTR